MSGAFCDGFKISLFYLASMMRFNLLVYKLNGAFYCDNANTLFIVESMSRQHMVASS